MMAGIPRDQMILYSTFAAAGFLGLQSILILPIFIAIYFILVSLYRIDDHYMEVLIKHINSPDTLIP